MKTEKEIRRQIEQLKKMIGNKHYDENISIDLMNQGSINALEWVIE